MVQALQLDDPIVNVDDIKKLKLAFLMQFFVQHRQRFRFSRLRLQDLYQGILNGSDVVPLCDCVVRILRFLRHRDPAVCITSVDESLDAFVSEKRTIHRQALQLARGGRSVSDLDPPARALLLEHLIECVYDERPDLSFNAVFNAPKDNAEKDVGILPLPDDESLLIKAGQDASGSSYYYMDDLRLYRETPLGGLSSYWSVAVGPTIQQWTSFIASLGRAGEEAELCHFLKKELFSYVQECIENPYMSDFADELNPSRLLDKEAAELAEIRQQRRLPAVSTALPSIKRSISSPVSHPAPPLTAEGGSGSSATSNSSDSTSTCPITPPNRTPSITCGAVQLSQPTMSKPRMTVPAIASLTAPSTPSAAVLMADYGRTSSLTAGAACCQQPNSVELPRSIYVARSSSPSQHYARATNDSGQQKQLLDSPLRRPASGPTFVDVASHADGGHPLSAPPFSAPSSVGNGQRRTSMASNSNLFSGQKPEADLEVCWHDPLVLEGMLDASPPSTIRMPSSTPNISRFESHSTVSASVPFPTGPSMLPPNALVFTTEIANEAAVKYRSARMRITTFHSMHSLVQQFMLQSGLIPCGANSAVSNNAGDCVVTQEQLENRKSKMAQLEKIHSKLTKSKMASTPGAATVAAMQQQQLYAAAAANGGGQLPQSLPSLPANVTMSSIQHDPPHLPHPTGGIPADLNQQSRVMMITRADERDFDRTSWSQQQRKQLGTGNDPNGVPCRYSGPVDHGVVLPPSDGGGPPVLVVSPTNPSPFNKFCIPAPPAHKRPYPPEMEPGEQQFWDQQQVMFEQQQQAMLMQQQQKSTCSRPASGRGGLGKKRKSATGGASRSALVRPLLPPLMSTFGGPQRISQPPPPIGAVKSGGFPCVLPTGSPRGSYHTISCDSMNGAYMGSNYRSSVNAPTMVERPQYPPVPPGSTSVLQSASSQQQPPSNCHTHPTDSVSVSSSPTQHLTSASLASLARLSQLSGSEGPFCPPSTGSCPPHPPTGYSRMASAPDMLAFPGGAGPGILSNPDCNPNSLYTIGSAPSNSSVASGGPSYQAMTIPRGGLQSQKSGFHMSHSQISTQQCAPFAPVPLNQPVGSDRSLDQAQISGPASGFTTCDQSRPVADPPSASRCLTPRSNSPFLHTSTSPTIVTTANSVPTPAPSTSQPASHQQLPLRPQSLQVNNTFFNTQLHLQQMSYQHINGTSGGTPIQIQFMQQQHQRPYYDNSGCPMSHPPPPNQRVEPLTSQPPTNVQIMPKTPHTIQYLPTSSASATPTPSATSNPPIMTSGQYPSQPAPLAINGKPRMPQSVASVSRIQSQTLSQVAPNTGASTTSNPSTTSGVTSAVVLAEHRGTTIPPRQHQRGQKVDPLHALPSQLPMTISAQSSQTGGGAEMGPFSVSMYACSGISAVPKYSQGFPISVVEASQVQQPDSMNPFDYPQGTAAYDSPSSNTTVHPRGHYHDLNIHYSPSTGSSTSAAFRVASDLPSPLSVPITTSNSAIPAGKKFLPSASQMYAGELPYQQQRWQQQPQMVGGGEDFYMQQSHNCTGSVMMMTPPPTMPASQVQQQYYMPPPGAVPSHLHQQLQPQTSPQASHSLL